MKSFRSLRAGLLSSVLLAVVLGVAGPRLLQAQGAAAATLPAKLSDADFWKLTADISEPGGYFQIVDNFTSNEGEIGTLFTAIGGRGLSGGVYVGVGPEQNLTYIAAIKPAMAFVIDIRRQAVVQHLIFKALFEMSKDRADFISLLFAKPRPQNVTASMPIQDMWNAFFAVLTDPALAKTVHDRVVERLEKTHGFTLTGDERAQLDGVMSAFVQFGPGITTRGAFQGRGGGSSNFTFADLTGWLPLTGEPQSFLSSDAHFQTVKALHDRNLIVAVSGDFGGPRALRAIGQYVRDHGSTITAFYVSNVEQYLFQDGKQTAFYDNVATLPVTDRSVFIRPYALRRGTSPGLCGITAFLKNVKDGRVATFNDSMNCN
ncbi:MAG TPA: hypothetical protein VFV78_14810 [Vicinamibacterales bacterium]|nr:hypothetical protein [Vicinamibacterales bacterium]